MRKLIVIAAFGALVSGCYTIRYVTNARPSGAVASEQWNHTFLNGIIPASAPINVQAICPKGMAVVENEVTFLNALLSGIANGAVASAVGYGAGQAGIDTGATTDPAIAAGPFSVGLQVWSPSTVKVMCAAGVAKDEAPAPGPFDVQPVAGR